MHLASLTCPESSIVCAMLLCAAWAFFASLPMLAHSFFSL